MKKLISIITIMILLLGIGASTVSAASCNVYVKASNTAPKIGDTVTVTVSFSVPILAADPIVLNYNNSVLQYVGSTATRATDMGSSVSLKYIDTTMSQKTISSINVTFKVKAEGEATCKVTSAVMADVDDNELENPNLSSSATITVKKEEVKEEEKPTTPTTPSTPTTPTTPTTPSTPITPTTPSDNDKETKEPTFKKVNQTVYAKSDVNIRASWSLDSNRLGTLEEGESITRTGTSSEWDRVSYNGKTAYIRAGFLTTTKPEDNKEEENKENNTENKIENEVVNETTNTTNNEAQNTENNEQNEVVDKNNEVDNETNVETPKKSSERDIILDIVFGIIILAIVIIVVISIRENRNNRKNRRK